ncbi:PAS domain S-box protein [Shewanella sp. 5S214]|uniref:PAS domain S-box protein n=1 Tax=Shewanella sp. 5S214 TaxID=3229999 RepID=UPI00352F2401
MLKQIPLLNRIKPHSSAITFVFAAVLMLIICHFVYWQEVGSIQREIDTVARAKADILREHIDNLKRETLFLSKLPDVKGIASLAHQPVLDTEQQAQFNTHIAHLKDVFKYYIQSIPELEQARFIDSKTGFETIRVERMKGSVIALPDSSLQQKSDRDYFIEAQKLQEGDVYVSPFNLNQENGSLVFPYLPVMRVSTLVFSQAKPQKESIGQIVINVSAEVLFSQLDITSTYSNINIYLVNDAGDYLLHPDKTKTFGFDIGQRYTLEDDFTDVGDGMYLTKDDSDFFSWLKVLFFSEENVYLDSTNTQRKVVVLAVANNHLAITKTLTVIFWYWVIIGILILLLKNTKNEVALKAKQQHLNTVLTMEQELNSILSHAPNGIMVVNRQGIITLANTQVERIFGYSQGELLGQSMNVLLPARFCHVHPNFMQAFFSAPETKLMGGGRELYGLHKTAKEVPLEIGLSVIEYKGELQAICGIVDITLRRQLEHLFEMVVDTLPNAVLLVDYNGVIELVNKQTERLFGYSRDDLLGNNIAMLVPESFREQHLAWRQSFFIAAGEEIDTERYYISGLCKDGTIFPLSIGLCTIETHKGKKLLSSIVDLTDSELEASALKKVTENLDRTSKMAGIGGWELDLITNELFYSEETYRIHGLPLGSKLSLDEAIAFYTPDSQPIIRKTLTEAIEMGKDWNVEVRFTNAANKLIWVKVAGTIEYENGKAVRLAGTMQDISERKYFIEELSRSNTELDNFAYVASHDLKSPLRGIDQLASWLEEDLKDKLEDEDAEHLRLMRGRISRMEKLLDDLLSYSRAGKKGDVIHSINIKSVVENVFDLCNTKNAFSLEFESATTDITTASVPLEQVIRNLINNAIKHHDTGKGTVYVSMVVNAPFYEFVVRDDGPGILDEFSEKIFTMFTTLKPRDEVEGSGMGLAIVKKIVVAMGGEISLDTSVQKGACFKFTWPMEIQNLMPNSRDGE